MKKLLSLAFFLLSASSLFAQFLTRQTLGSASTIVQSKGALGADSGFVNAAYPDTLTASKSKIAAYPGAQIRVGNTIWLRDSSATRWIRNVGATQGSILNDSTFILCNSNGCDTFIVRTIAISNFTFISDSSVAVCNGSNVCDTIYFNPTPLSKFYVDSTKLIGDSLFYWVNGIRYKGGAVSGSPSGLDSTAYHSLVQGAGYVIFNKPNGVKDTLLLPFKKITDSVNVALLNGGKIDTSHIPEFQTVINHLGSGSQLIFGSGSDSIHSRNVQAGANITITENGDGSLTISSSGSSGGTGGISKLGSPTFGLTKVNDSTYVVDSAALSLTYPRIKDSGVVYVTPTQLTNSKVTVITKSPLATFLKHGADPYDSIGIRQAGTTDSGYLSKEDWNKFNNTTDTSFRVIRADNLQNFTTYPFGTKKGLYMINYTDATVSSPIQHSAPIYFRASAYSGGVSYKKWIRMYESGVQTNTPIFNIDGSTDSTTWTNMMNLSTTGVAFTSVSSSTYSGNAQYGNNNMVIRADGTVNFGAFTPPLPMVRLQLQDTAKGLLITRGSTLARLKLGSAPYKATVINGGSGYTGTNFSSLPLLGGSGTNVANQTSGVISSGVITSIIFGVNCGYNYKVGDTVSVNALGGSGFKAIITKLQGDTVPGLMFYDTTINKLFTWNTAIHNWEGYGTTPHSIFTPITGGTVTTTAQQEHIINPAGTIAALTIALPSAPYNNDHVWLKFTQAVTAITYSGGMVVGLPTSASVGQQWYLTYDSSTSTWY